MRESGHPKVKQPVTKVVEGDIVMMKQNPNKHNLRDSFIVTNSKSDSVEMYKLPNPFQSTKQGPRRNKTYNTTASKLINLKHASSTLSNKFSTNQKLSIPKTKTWSPIRDNTSDSDSDCYADNEDEENEPQHQQDQGHQNEYEPQHDIVYQEPQNIDLPEPGLPEPGLPQPGLPEPGLPEPGPPQPGIEEPQNIDQHNVHDPDNQNTDRDSNSDSSAHSPQQPVQLSPERPKRTPVKEFWLTNQPKNMRPAKIQAKVNLKKMKENLRAPDLPENLIISELDSSRQSYTYHGYTTTSPTEDLPSSPLVFTKSNIKKDRDTSEDESNAEQLSMEWDDGPPETPTFLNNAFAASPTLAYPVNVVPNKVYNFDALPPLPPSITSNIPDTEPLPLISDSELRRLPPMRIPENKTSTPNPDKPTTEMEPHSTVSEHKDKTTKLKDKKKHFKRLKNMFHKK